MTSDSCCCIQGNTLHHVRLDFGKSFSYPALKLDPTVGFMLMVPVDLERCTLAVDGGAEVKCSPRSLLVPHVPKVRAIKRT